MKWAKVVPGEKSIGLNIYIKKGLKLRSNLRSRFYSQKLEIEKKGQPK